MALLPKDTEFTISFPMFVSSSSNLTFNSGQNASLPKKTPKPVRVSFNDQTTIVFFDDGSKQVVTCGVNDVFDMEHGVAMAIAQRLFGSKNQFKKFVRENSTVQPTKREKQKTKEEKKRLKDEEDDLFPF